MPIGRLTKLVDVKDYSRVFVNISDYDDLNSCIAAVSGSNQTIVIASTTIITSNLYVPSTIELVVSKNGYINLQGYTLTIGGDFSAGLYQVFSTNGTTILTSSYLQEIFPEWWGASANLSIDSTTAIQEAFATLKLSTCRKIKFTTSYKITDEILLDFYGFTISGIDSLHTTIKQYTSNKSILKFTTDNIFNVVIEKLCLEHVNNPTSATTSQYGIQFRPTSDGSGGTNAGAYLNKYDDIVFKRSYYGIGIYTISGGVYPIWSSTFSKLTFWGTYRTALYLKNDGNTGQPSNSFTDINILNYASYGIVNDGNPAIQCNGQRSWAFRNINIEDWVDSAFISEGGASVTFDCIRFERHVIQSPFVRLFNFGGGNVVINNLDVGDIRNNLTSGYSFIVRLQGSTDLVFNGFAHQNTVGSPNTQPINLIGSAEGSGNRAIYNGIGLLSGIFVEYLPTAYSNELYGRISFNGFAPEVDVLPTASWVYRGRQFRVLGGAGVADKTYLCNKQSNDTYSWVEI